MNKSSTHPATLGVSGVDRRSVRNMTGNLASGASGTVFANVKNAFDPLIKARLTDVVQRLRGPAGIGVFWGEIHPIRQEFIGELEKRVATSLCESFFAFSQFLCCVEVLLLECDQLCAQGEQGLLSLEKKLLNLENFLRNHRGISDAQ